MKNKTMGMTFEEMLAMFMRGEADNLKVSNENGARLTEYIKNKGLLRHFIITTNYTDGITLFKISEFSKNSSKDTKK